MHNLSSAISLTKMFARQGFYIEQSLFNFFKILLRCGGVGWSAVCSRRTRRSSGQKECRGVRPTDQRMETGL